MKRSCEHDVMRSDVVCVVSCSISSCRTDYISLKSGLLYSIHYLLSSSCIWILYIYFFLYTLWCFSSAAHRLLLPGCIMIRWTWYLIHQGSWLIRWWLVCGTLFHLRLPIRWTRHIVVILFDNAHFHQVLNKFKKKTILGISLSRCGWISSA